MIRREKLRRRNARNARRSGRGIDNVRKNGKRNVKESVKRSMKRRNLTGNGKRKSTVGDIEMTTMTAEERTEEMTDGVIASAIAIAPLIATTAFLRNQAQTTMMRVGQRYHIGGLKVDLTNLI